MSGLKSIARHVVMAWVGAACVSALAGDLPPVKVAEARAPLAAEPAASAPTVMLKKTMYTATNDKVGMIQSGIFCSGTKDLLFTTAVGSVIMRDLGKVTRKELDAAGYPRPPTNDSAFQSGPPASTAADYEIGATLRGFQLNSCTHTDGVDGGLWLQMRWELFSPRAQKVIYSVVTEGSVQTGPGEHLALNEMVRRAQTVAVRNLLAEAAFADFARKAPTGEAALPGAAELARLRIAHRVAAGRAIGDRVPQLQSAVATLASGVGTGSGFYIDAQGYLLTNQHVVGDAKFIKVKLASGRELVGEVLRSDRPRDVALVKTEAVALAPIDVGETEARPGDDVYAIGSPLGETYASTLTRGVLSGVRTMEDQRWLQSDVKILPGSSGGPLLGRDGAALGLTSRGVAAGVAGLNLFVPIKDAMQVLKIDFSE